MARALFHTAEWLYIALQKLRQDLSAKHRQLPAFYNLSQHEIYRRLTGNPHLLDFDLRFAAILVYLQVLPTLEYVKSYGTSGSPVIAPEILETLFLGLWYPFRLKDVKAALGEYVPSVTKSSDFPPPADAKSSCRPAAPLACTAPTAWPGRRVIEEITPAQVIQGVMMFHCLSDNARTYNRTIGLRSVLAARADAVLGIKGQRGAWLVVDAGIRLPPVFWLGVASGLTLAQLDAACAISSDDAPACTGQVFNNGGGFNGNSWQFFYLGNMSSTLEKMTGATRLPPAQTQRRQQAMLNAQAMAREPHIQKVTFYEPLLGAENDKLLLRRLSPQGIKAEPYEFSEARKFTGLLLEGTKARLRQLQRRIEVDEAAFKAFISLFLSSVDDRELARVVASFNDVLRRACDFINNITRLNYTNVAMVGTDDGNRTAISSALSPTMLKKTPLFYAAQDAYVKGLVVITDPLVKLLLCHDYPDVKKRIALANDELLKQIILLSSPVNRFITLQHDASATVPKICSTDPEDVLTQLEVHFSDGLMTELTRYAEKHRLPPTQGAGCQRFYPTACRAEKRVDDE
ncbi:hypothetical protein JZM24_02120 [Candidatus Sodalis endolongispinus]|uniref:Uncharacterized protein n=1 Tax=Candidatus Sodalis endolongispinus TaxID=2812662 RepID=A0ABS5Y8J1_9GAMM|nr:hypothetical protein [Candidatus Sodalis endolongispinus]MBT9431257.1 hypothetical protein [Candidatus Sodalis endolongispinus]